MQKSIIKIGAIPLCKASALFLTSMAEVLECAQHGAHKDLRKAAAQQSLVVIVTI